MKILDNARKGIITTITGCLIILGALFLQFKDGSTSWVETIPAITFGLTLIGVNDPKVLKNP